ncbi:hypothetical protein jhhlp_006919 [Lomentospora prolificans]|uniref:BCAS3 domain-containing protein n=1 Tax=Lomentospora prolificans TaxID=41688 RepID=A0A2N3N347_9PEZI|nr:hypothetical protein jhhlp_006919 [Lomentospora prolificans]
MPKKKKDGGVAAALAKQIASNKSTSSSSPASNESSSSNTSSPLVQSPDVKPTAVPTINNANVLSTAASPSLDALSTTSISASTAPSTDWMRGAFSGSPGNLVSLMGESPPTQPSSYEDSARPHSNWPSPRAYMSPQVAASPPVLNSMRRPQSMLLDAAGDVRGHPSTTSYRRGSVSSQFSHARVPSVPPLPHQPQAHFYGVPDLDLDMASNNGLKAGERGYHFGFDTFPRRHADPIPGSDNVVVAGYEGGLEVYSVSKRGLDPVASLKGLRGGVYNAKILPWPAFMDEHDIYPLVAVVIHGPLLPTGSAEQETQQPPSMAGLGTRSSAPGSPRLVVPSRGQNPPIEYYQTSVEVYSLRTSQRVDVLLQASQVPIEASVPITSHMFSPPPPTGNFHIRADAGTIAVSSGVTGECWLYRQLPIEPGANVGFGCIAKIWTSIQRGLKSDENDENDQSRLSPSPPRPTMPNMPILALSGRWIAYCPPTQSSQLSLRAQVPVPVLGKGPGISTVTAPPVPAANLATDLPISEGIMKKLMRETTQELIQGAKWVGQQGKQAWNAYWNKSPSPNQPQLAARSPPPPSQPWGSSYPPRQDAAQFPPTHGTAGQAVTKDPGLVSIIDIDTIGGSASIHSAATFSAPFGCSFLSFSPTGLSLFTVSSKGDVQTVWDLLGIQYTKSSPLQALATPSGGGPRVRQIAQFSRMTVARVVDVAWAKPTGEWIAMVTERGTVHLLDMPPSAFTWPPPRRRRDVPETAAPSESSSSAVSIASTALGAAFGAARPLMSRPRRSSANSAGFSGSNIVDSASLGGRAIAATISNSLGKTGNAINQLRQTGENRVSLPPSHVLPKLGCVVWITGKKHSVLFAATAGVVRMYPSKSRKNPAKTPRGGMYRDFNVPGIPEDVLADAVRHFINGDDEMYLSDRDMDAGNTVTLEARPRIVEPEAGTESSIPRAEIESSAPYQPFHTDRRVALYSYTEESGPAMDILLGDLSLDDHLSAPKKKSKGKKSTTNGGSSSTGSDVWAFGQMIPATKLDLGLPDNADDSLILPEDHRALPASAMERVLQVVANEEQIVVTTRRRRGVRHAEHDEDGFFEDDCEVLDFADQRV